MKTFNEYLKIKESDFVNNNMVLQHFANLDDFDRLLARVPDTEPDKGDELQK